MLAAVMRLGSSANPTEAVLTAELLTGPIGPLSWAEALIASGPSCPELSLNLGDDRGQAAAA